ncbi:membrane protein insertion efficiency factor YidD [Micromonospora soli]|uniref:membrane protein insertion efficiency factor YidD n=1 Tax=Micromonospora sp. NBRC 110009 TaxID=3061627 RepID=UPI0026739FD2|nr:membrane protein insertion efficiency factor YidD [Micromonospora sp. NBRC 110009]WKT99945.1 membrane protein insertion efficiency factor YidD [Micromonospora sp. NBRC 110009]
MKSIRMLTLGSVVAGAARVSAVDRAGRAAILGYRRWLSHRWPGQCRFTPTCSIYGLAAVEKYGLAVGGRMAAERVRRCKPHVPRGTHDPLRCTAETQAWPERDDNHSVPGRSVSLGR